MDTFGGRESFECALVSVQRHDWLINLVPYATWPTTNGRRTQLASIRCWCVFMVPSTVFGWLCWLHSSCLTQTDIATGLLLLTSRATLRWKSVSGLVQESGLAGQPAGLLPGLSANQPRDTSPAVKVNLPSNSDGYKKVSTLFYLFSGYAMLVDIRCAVAFPAFWHAITGHPQML